MRVLAALLIILGFSACTSDEAKDAGETSSGPVGDVTFCVAAVRLEAFSAVEAKQLEEGKSPEYANPFESPAFRAFVAAAPDDLQDDLSLASQVPPPSDTEYAAAGKAIDARLARDCRLGEEAESPLSAECRERSVALQRRLAVPEESTDGEIEAFGKECRPDTDPFASLDDRCAGFVYGHFVKPSVEGVIDASGGVTGSEDKAIAARFTESCA